MVLIYMKKSCETVFCFNRSYSMGILSDSDEISVDLINTVDDITYPVVNSEGYFVNYPGIANPDVIAPYYKGITTNIQPIVYYPSRFEVTKDGLYIVRWQLQPDGVYWADSQGFGQTSDYEIFLYSYLNEQGKFIAPFRVYNIANVQYFGTNLEEQEQKQHEKRKLEEMHRIQSNISIDETLKFLIEKACLVNIDTFSKKEKACFVAFEMPSSPYEAFITIVGKSPNWRLRVDMKIINTDRIFSQYIKVGDHDKDWIIEQLQSKEVHEEIFKSIISLRDRLDRD